MPSPVLSATREVDCGLLQPIALGVSGTAAPHSIFPPTSSSFHVCSQLPFLRGFHAGLCFLDILISSPVIERRSIAGTCLQVGVDLWGCRPKALWVFLTCTRHELFRAGSGAVGPRHCGTISLVRGMRCSELAQKLVCLPRPPYLNRADKGFMGYPHFISTLERAWSRRKSSKRWS